MTQETKIKAGDDDPSNDIQVTVTYLPARKPANFKFPATTPLSAVKAAVLNEFGVAEGPTPDGQSQVVFFLYDDDRQLTDLSQGIGSIADHGHHAKLKLVKQIVQG